jgi:hypothetical protein
MLKFLEHFFYETGGVSADGVASEDTHKYSRMFLQSYVGIWRMYGALTDNVHHVDGR